MLLGHHHSDWFFLVFYKDKPGCQNKVLETVNGGLQNKSRNPQAWGKLLILVMMSAILSANTWLPVNHVHIGHNQYWAYKCMHLTFINQSAGGIKNSEGDMVYMFIKTSWVNLPQTTLWYNSKSPLEARDVCHIFVEIFQRESNPNHKNKKWRQPCNLAYSSRSWFKVKIEACLHNTVLSFQ